MTHNMQSFHEHYSKTLSDAQELARKYGLPFSISVFNELRYSSRHVVDAYAPLKSEKMLDEPITPELDRAQRHVDRASCDIPEAEVDMANEMLKIIISQNPDLRRQICQYVDPEQDASKGASTLMEMRRELLRIDEFDKNSESYIELRKRYIETAWLCCKQLEDAGWVSKLQAMRGRLSGRRTAIFWTLNTFFCIAGAVLGCFLGSILQ